MNGDFNPLKIEITEQLLKSHPSAPVNLFNALVGEKERARFIGNPEAMKRVKAAESQLEILRSLRPDVESEAATLRSKCVR